MDKRYQVFVSSTYEDLRAERAEVIQALLELDCMPAGMELFPAATEEQWKWISRVIDESDYYLVIIGGRYGTVHPQKGLSYTELEYRYAVEAGKPVIAFLHGSPSDIPAGKTEKEPKRLEQLLDFRQFCQQRLCKYWDTPLDLGGKVSRSVNQLIKHHPAVGWVRADTVSTEQRLAEVELREEAARLRAALESKGPQSAEIAAGDDPLRIAFFCETREAKVNKSGNRYWVNGDSFWETLDTTWNNILRIIGSDLLYSPTENEVCTALNEAGDRAVRRTRTELNQHHILSSVKVSADDVGQIRTQLIALGTIEVVKANRQLQWTLTPTGRKTVYDLLTVKRDNRDPAKTGRRQKRPKPAIEPA